MRHVSPVTPIGSLGLSPTRSFGSEEICLACFERDGQTSHPITFLLEGTSPFPNDFDRLFPRWMRDMGNMERIWERFHVVCQVSLKEEKRYNIGITFY